jgi:small subunit ribosomal protein S10
MIQINLKSLNKESLTLYINFIKKTLKKINLNYKVFNQPNKKKKITLLKSPHVNKTAREQFELKSYKCSFFIDNIIISYKNLYFLLFNKPKTIKLAIKILGK